MDPKKPTKYVDLDWRAYFGFKNQSPLYRDINFTCSYSNDVGVGPNLNYKWRGFDMGRARVRVRCMVELIQYPGAGVFLMGNPPVPPKRPIFVIVDDNRKELRQPAIGGEWEKTLWGPRGGGPVRYTGAAYSYQCTLNYTGRPIVELRMSTWWMEGSEQWGDEDTTISFTMLVNVLDKASDEFVFPFAEFPILDEECGGFTTAGLSQDWTLL